MAGCGVGGGSTSAAAGHRRAGRPPIEQYDIPQVLCVAAPDVLAVDVCSDVQRYELVTGAPLGARIPWREPDVGECDEITAMCAMVVGGRPALFVADECHVWRLDPLGATPW